MMMAVVETLTGAELQTVFINKAVCLSSAKAKT